MTSLRATASIATLSYAQTGSGLTASTTATAYSGPVETLRFQYLGSNIGQAVAGTVSNDFINALGGDDAVNGGRGSDVIDGGTGSNFLTGGPGLDTFFLDGRGGTNTWGTITDWQLRQQLSIWGFRPGVSRLHWVDQDGTEGYRGVTLHADLDASGLIDTSVTWTGLAREALPTPLEYDGLLWFSWCAWVDRGPGFDVARLDRGGRVLTFTTRRRRYMLKPRYRTRFPGHAIALCGAPEVAFEAGGASVERAEVAVLLDQPRGVLDGSKVADGVADLVDGLEDAAVDGLLL